MLTRIMNEFAPLMRLRDDMNRLFESFFEDMPAGRGYAVGFPAMNLWEDGETAYVEAELPGLGMEDIEVLVHGNELTINGQRNLGPRQDRNVSYHRRERATGQFSRTLTLPWEVQAENVQAKLADGVLTVTLPKSESARPKKVKLLTA